MEVTKSSIKKLGFFTLVLTTTFVTIAWYTLETMKIDYKQRKEELLDAESDLWVNSLYLSINQAKRDGEWIANEIAYRMDTEFNKDQDAIAEALDNYRMPNNPIREIVLTSIDGYYFNDIVSNNTDPIIIKGREIGEDNSADCVSFGSTRAFTLEMLMHANPKLALKQLIRVAVGDTDSLIFWQFVDYPGGEDLQKPYGEDIPKEHRGKKAKVLSSYDLKGLKEEFNRTESWEDTFEAFEFLVPTYIYYSEDLAGRPFVSGGKRTEYERLVLLTTFNFKTVVDNNPILKRDLHKYSILRKNLKNTYDLKELSVYVLVIFLIIICFLAMNYTNKLTLERYRERSDKTV